jgi:hypothetical protein
MVERLRGFGLCGVKRYREWGLLPVTEVIVTR